MSTAIISFLLPLLSLVCVQAADPDPLNNFAANVTNFTFRNVFVNGEVTHGDGGVRAALNPTIFPAMESQGLTYVHFRMLPCGVNVPHTHPRASEMLTLVSGGPLQVGFVDTEGVAHVDVINPGDITIFPRGMLHFELNLGNETAFYISALNSQAPGTLTAAAALLQVPDRALATSFNINQEKVAALKEALTEYSSKLQASSMSGCVPGKDVVNNF